MRCYGEQTSETSPAVQACLRGWYQGKTAVAIPPTLEIAVHTETEEEIKGLIRAPEPLTGRSVMLMSLKGKNTGT